MSSFFTPYRHQFVRVGALAMVGGDSGLVQDAPPFMITSGTPPAVVFGLNTIGLQRNGVSPESRRHLKTAFRFLYRSGLTLPEAVERIKAELPLVDEVAELLKFIAGTRRGLAAGSLSRKGRSGAPSEASVTTLSGSGHTYVDSHSEPHAAKLVAG